MAQQENRSNRPQDQQGPQEGPAEDRFGSTRFGAAAASELPGERPFHVGCRVRVSRLRTRQMGGDRIGELGTGCLVDELAVGRPLRIEVEWGPALVTSPVRSLQHIGQSVVQVDTLNSIYRLERTAASPAATSATRGGSEGAAQAAAEPSLREPAAGAAEEASEDATGYVALTELAEPEDVVFAPGTRVRILRRKSAGPGGESFEVVGSGQVLDLLETGASARLAVEKGPSFITSPLQKIRLLDLHLIEFETKNSVYRLERLARGSATRG